MMQPPSERIEDLFENAIGIPSPSVRSAYLEAACQGDADLRREVESLLIAHDEVGDFLDPRHVAQATNGSRSSLTSETSEPDHNQTRYARLEPDRPGALIGPYKLLQLIGEGGMGAVYRAEQTAPLRRTVALKILKLGMDSRRIIARFEAERQALAMMEHPNIARVLDAGTTVTGRPYFVMELVRGIPITAYCDQNNVPVDARLKLFVEVCQAVQHAHQKGIIHRDLKPANILVTLQDGVPVPKIIDFGIAKAIHQPLTDKTLFTEFKQFIGTPQYMSPEQASISGLDVDTRADIYSLGVVLYELLTSQTPLDAKTLQSTSHPDLQRLIQEVDPPTPSTRLSTLGEAARQIAQKRRTEVHSLSRLIRGDLDWVVMKALDKDRTRRYDTALELAQDVERHLRSEPILAGSPTLVDGLRKFTRRHRVGVITTAAVGLAIVLGAVLATAGWLRASQQTQIARLAESQAQVQAARSQAISDFLQEILASVHPQQVVGMTIDIEHALATARAVFGDEHATVAATMTSLAARLEYAGDLKSAEALLIEALRLWEEIEGRATANYLTTFTRLGNVQAAREDDRSAEQTFREVIQLSSQVAGDGLSAVADAHAGLAEILAIHGNHEEAAAAWRQSLLVQPVASGQRFVRIQRLQQLRQALAETGRYEEAESVWRQHHSLAHQLYPAGSLRLAELNLTFARFLSERGKTGEAEQRVREAIAIYETRPALPLEPLIVAQRFLYDVLVSQSDGFIKAEALRQQIEANARRLWGAGELRLADMLVEFAQVAYRRSQPGIAIHQAMAALHIYRQDGGTGFDPKPLIQLIRWSVMMANRGHYPHEVYAAAVRGAQVVVDSEPEEARAHMILGVAQFRAGHFEAARRTLVQADRHYSGPSGGAPTTLAFLAMSHFALGELDPAQHSLARAQVLMQDPRWAGDADDQGVVNEATTFFATYDNPLTMDHSHGCLTGT